MAYFRCSSGGGGKNADIIDLTGYDLSTITDANPLVINGNFANATQMFSYGRYVGSGSYSSYTQGEWQEIVLGTTYQVKSGKVSYQGWRKVTVYSDRVVIGNGGYQNTLNSTYGILEHLAIG